MSRFPKIWFLRHGETLWNSEGRIQGQLESPLTPRGIGHAHTQAHLIAPVMQADPPCFVSPLGRARQTADIALNGAEYTIDPRLAEAQAGKGQGLTRSEADQKWPGILAANPNSLELFCALPEAEGFESFHGRILEFMTNLQEPSVIVAHGLLGQVVRGIVTGLSREEMGWLPNDQGCVYVLEDGTERVLAAPKPQTEKTDQPAVF
ncbi:MAG: histidine phosphatase family protein [Paracoccaceae bacterium]